MSLCSSGKCRKETSSLLIICLATLVDLLYRSYPLLAMATPTLCYRSRLLLLLLNNNVSTVKKPIKHSKNYATCTVNKKYHWHHCMYKYIYQAVSLRILLPNDLKLLIVSYNDNVLYYYQHSEYVSSQQTLTCSQRLS